MESNHVTHFNDCGCLSAKHLAAIRALREVLELEKQVDDFDCPHLSEDYCGCGNSHLILLGKYRKAREEALAQASEVLK